MTFIIASVKLTGEAYIMNINILAICIAAVLSFGGIAIAIFYGLRGFTNKLTDKLTNAKDAITEQLSGINEKIVRIEVTGDKFWELAREYLAKPPGTVEKQLKNFGNVKISAEPSGKETRYTFRMERGEISLGLIDRLTKLTSFEEHEREMLNGVPELFALGPNAFRMVVPSVDPKVCTRYISDFLRWLDTEYTKGKQELLKDFEEGIEI